MKNDTPTLTEQDLIEFVARGAARLTPREVYRLVAELPNTFQPLRQNAQR